MALTREEIVKRAAQEFQDGFYVNLGIGMPTLAANYVPEGMDIILHSENGLLGIGPFPLEDEVDADLINAGKQTVSTIAGSSFFDSGTSFAMVRGGHVDLTILGAMQVAGNGDIANWSTGEPGAIPAVGGAMDLVQGVKNIFVITQHTTKTGEPKLVERCSYPLTGQGVVSRIYTNLAVVDVTDEGFRVVELAPEVTFEEVEQQTGAPILPAE